MGGDCYVSSCKNTPDYENYTGDGVYLCKEHKKMQSRLFRKANRRDRRRKAPSNPSYTKKRRSKRK